MDRLSLKMILFSWNMSSFILLFHSRWFWNHLSIFLDCARTRANSKPYARIFCVLYFCFVPHSIGND